ncbi:MAG TPA: hypothetical protein VJ932_08690 [Alkalispirochaeta sp.]|nr:hypothetical protein [Alkalispirochaeta sp.]
MTDRLTSPEDIFQQFESRTNLERTTAHLRLYRLERMIDLLSRLGEPQGERPTVHLAGSKGKGSTAAYLTSLLVASGRTVGLYTSPHITSYRERFTIHRPPHIGNDDPAEADLRTYEDRILVEQGRRIWAVVESMIANDVPEDDLPTTFELLTALAFCYFPAVGCDWIVLETGLGGRLDATNVCHPIATIITRIELEHTDYLGDTRAAIAGEKAGIIKDRIPVILQPQHPEADPVFRRVAAERNAPVYPVEPLAPATPTTADDERPAVLLPGWAGAATVVPAMLGSVHRTNIAAALEAYRYLTTKGLITAATPEAIAQAVATTRLPGRGELIDDIILDGAHTVESAAALADTVARMLPVGTRIPVILGVVAGKNVEGIAGELARIASVFIVSRPGRFKPGDPVDVARRVAAAGHETILEESATQALAEARHRRGSAPHPIIVSGSFYMVAEIRRLVVS